MFEQEYKAMQALSIGSWQAISRFTFITTLSTALFELGELACKLVLRLHKLLYGNLEI